MLTICELNLANAPKPKLTQINLDIRKSGREKLARQMVINQ